MQSGCRFREIWRVLAVAGTVGAASVALAEDPVKPVPPQKNLTSVEASRSVPANKVENPKAHLLPVKQAIPVKGPEDNSGGPVLRGPGQPNDNCADAILIGVPSSTPGSTVGATASFEAGVCAGAGLSSAGVWYRLTGTGNPVRVETCGAATFDTVLRAFSGDCNFLVCEGYNDDACSLQSAIQFGTIAGVEYRVYVSAFGAAAAGDFTLTAIDLGAPPPGDTCASAVPLGALPASVSGSTAAASPNPESGCTNGLGDNAPTVWYSVVGTGGIIQASTCGSSYDTLLSVLTGDCNFPTCVAVNDDFCGLQSQLTFNSVAGQTYYIAVRGYFTSSGSYVLNVQDLGIPQPGDDCASAFPIAIGGSASGDTSSFLPDSGLPACGPGATSRSTWYQVVGNGNILEATMCNGPFYDSAMAVYTGSCGALTCVVSDDDGCGTFAGLSRASFRANAGQTYYIVVRGWSAADAGPYTLDVNDLGPPPAGDDCFDALPLTVPGNASGDTNNYTPDAGIPACGAGAASRSVWYAVTGTGNMIRATTCNGTTYDSALSIFTGDCNFLTCVASNDDACGLQSTVMFQSNLGQTYYIVVRGFSTSAGFYNLDVDEVLPPPNDDCINAIAIGCNTTVVADNTGATVNFATDTFLCRFGGGEGFATIWYSFVATDESAVVETCGSVFPADDSIIQVYGAFNPADPCTSLFPWPDGCSEDFCGLNSRAIVRNLIVGDTYYIQLSAWGAADVGPYSLTVTCPAPPPPSNDDCVDAIALSVPSVVNGDTSQANADFVDFCGAPIFGAPGVWYSVVATDERLRAETCGSAYDTVLVVYTGDCSFPTCVAFNDDSCGFQSRVVWDTVVGQTYYVYVSGYATSSGAFTLSIDVPPPPCEVVPPPGATDEGEPNCGIPDTTNGGCNSAPPVFASIACGETIYGSAAFDGFTRDTDWFQFTLTETTTVTFTVAAEFPALVGFLETTTPAPTGACSEFTGFVSPFGFPAGDCFDFPITTTLGPGVWTVFVAPQFLDPFLCGSTGSRYLATLTFDGGCGGGGGDCNENGIPDDQEIAGNPALDCYNPLVLQNPNVMGGSDGIIDACQCAANWNRDGAVNSTDLSTFITSWLAAVNSQTTGADINCSGTVNSTDLSAFITLWLSALNNTVPYDGCP